MRILAVDTTGALSSAAVADRGRVLHVCTQDGGRAHSRTVLPLIERALAGAGLLTGQIDRFCAVTGPGSFTGIRVGVSAIKGLGWALGTPCCGIDALAAQVRALDLTVGARVLSCILAREDEHYCAWFLVQNGAVSALGEPFLAREGALVAKLEPDDLLCGAELSGAGRKPVQPVMPLAAAAAMLAFERPAVRARELMPDYMKKTQAERMREERG